MAAASIDLLGMALLPRSGHDGSRWLSSRFSPSRRHRQQYGRGLRASVPTTLVSGTAGVSYFGTIYKNNSIRKSDQDYAYCS